MLPACCTLREALPLLVISNSPLSLLRLQVSKEPCVTCVCSQKSLALGPMDAMSALKHAHRSVISGSTRTCRSRTRLSARSHLRSQSYSSLETGKTRVSPRLETRNLLRSTSNLFSSLDERVFGAKNLWKDRINTAADRLSSSHPPRIAGEQNMWSTSPAAERHPL